MRRSEAKESKETRGSKAKQSETRQKQAEGAEGWAKTRAPPGEDEFADRRAELWKWYKAQGTRERAKDYQVEIDNKANSTATTRTSF